MPRTEAGKRLLDDLRYLNISWKATDGSELNAAFIDAIEAEAVAAERERVAREVEGLEWRPSDDQPKWIWDERLGLPPGTVPFIEVRELLRKAVLAIIDKESE